MSALRVDQLWADLGDTSSLTESSTAIGPGMINRAQCTYIHHHTDRCRCHSIIFLRPCFILKKGRDSSAQPCLFLVMCMDLHTLSDYRGRDGDRQQTDVQLGKKAQLIPKENSEAQATSNISFMLIVDSGERLLQTPNTLPACACMHDG